MYFLYIHISLQYREAEQVLFPNRKDNRKALISIASPRDFSGAAGRKTNTRILRGTRRKEIHLPGTGGLAK